MSASITISYELKPSTGTSGGGLLDSKEHAFPIKIKPADGQKAYYTALKEVIADAKNQVGMELTAWRDKAEPLKDAKQAIGDDDEEEDEEA